MFKKIIALLLVFALVGCQAPASNTDVSEAAATKVFIDSSGREVQVPVEISKVAVSGPLAQIIVFAIAPDKLAGIAAPWDKSAEQYLFSNYYNLPMLGQLYGGKGELNLETLISSGAEVIIDIGESKKEIAEDMSTLQEQTNIPTVHISCTPQTMSATFILLGDLLGMENEATELASNYNEIYERTLSIVAGKQKPRTLYILGENGLNVIAKDSYHAGLIDMLSDNIAVVDEPSGRGTGNEVDMEQILNWNPDILLIQSGSIYDEIATDVNWKNINAVKNNNYYEVPFGPYNFCGFPPASQCLLGMLWLSELFYPEAVKTDLFEELSIHYKLFFHADLTQEQFDKLMERSL